MDLKPKKAKKLPHHHRKGTLSKNCICLFDVDQIEKKSSLWTQIWVTSSSFGVNLSLLLICRVQLSPLLQQYAHLPRKTICSHRLLSSRVRRARKLYSRCRSRLRCSSRSSSGYWLRWSSTRFYKRRIKLQFHEIGLVEKAMSGKSKVQLGEKFCRKDIMRETSLMRPQSTYIPRVPLCMSPRPNWLSPPLITASELCSRIYISKMHSISYFSSIF
jgi:hypothetical protein